MLPPSPLAASAEPEPDARPMWWRTAVAVVLLPAVGFLLTWGSELVEGLVQSLVGRPVHLPPLGIVPMLGPGYLTAALTVTVAFGFVPGALIALIDRRRPYLAAGGMPAVFSLFAVLGALETSSLTDAASVVIVGLLLSLATWLSAAAGIALVRSARRP